MNGIWFDTGMKNNDGSPFTVAAYSEVQYREYVKKGWEPVIEAAAPGTEAGKIEPSEGEGGDGEGRPEGVEEAEPVAETYEERPPAEKATFSDILDVVAPPPPKNITARKAEAKKK